MQVIDENDGATILANILPKIMADLERRSPSLREELTDVVDDLTDAILDAAMPDIQDLNNAPQT